MAGRVCDIERTPARLDPLAVAANRDDIRGGHRRDLAPQLVHLISVQARGAFEQLRRIYQMGGAALVDVYRDPRVPPDDRAGRSRMIEVDVREQEMRDVAEPETLRVETELEHIKTGRRPRVNQRKAAGAARNGGRNHVGAASEFQVDPGEAGRKDGHSKRGIILVTLDTQPPLPGSQSRLWDLGLGI